MVKSKEDDNVFRYLKWRGDLNFDQDPFNDVDSFIISQLTFLELMISDDNNPKPLKQALAPYSKLKKFDEINLGVMIPKDCLKLGKTLIKINRFHNLIISDFVKTVNAELIEQFCALTIHLNDELMVVAFQGTDDTLIGWEENFDMITKFPIPAQESAKKYIDLMSEKYPNKKIITTGHSKGGNLSVYAGLFTSYQNRIVQIYNFDGPGFELKNIDMDIIKDNINKVINIYPEHSTVGMIFDHLGKTKIIKSNEKGLLQHNGFSWTIDYNHFSKATLSNNSLKFHDDLNELVQGMSEEERNEFSSSLRRYVEKINVNTLVELSNIPVKPIFAYKEFSKKEKTFINRFIKLFIQNRML